MTRICRAPRYAKDSGNSFANVITGWTIPETDQSDPNVYKNRDLQTASASTDGATRAFTMTHQMGLLVINMGVAAANTIPETIYYDRNTSTPVYQTGKLSTALSALGDFSGSYKPCPLTAEQPRTSASYYYIVKNGTEPSTTVVFSSACGQWSAFNWKTHISSETVTSNKCYCKTTDAPICKNVGRLYKYVAASYDPSTRPDHSSASESPYSYTAPVPGTYRMECWGAAGGYGFCTGTTRLESYGRGAYTAGDLTLSQEQWDSYKTLYVYVGGRGQSCHGARYDLSKGGYNGGGNGVSDNDSNDSGAGGGGATDIRIANGTWDNAASLRARIMVAAGGGGGNAEAANDANPGPHGAGPNHTNASIPGWSGSRTVTVNQGAIAANSQWNATVFGKGGNGTKAISHHGDGGGGGGYYGGPSSLHTNGNYSGNAPGGSSFVSGHSSCIGVISSASNNQRTDENKTHHYSELIFSNIDIIRGYNTLPSPTAAAVTPLRANTSGISTETTGHTADGYARITFFPYGK